MGDQNIWESDILSRKGNKLDLGDITDVKKWGIYDVGDPHYFYFGESPVDSEVERYGLIQTFVETCIIFKIWQKYYFAISTLR